MQMDVKQVNVALSKGQYERLEEKKGDRTWREAMLEEFGVRQEADQ